MMRAITVAAVIVAAGVLAAGQQGERGAGAPQGRGEGRGRGPAMKLSDPVITDPAVQNGGIDLHAHQDPDSNGPSYGQAARSIDAMDLYTRAKAAGMRGFVIKEHLDQTASLAYYLRKLHPDMEIFGGMGSNLTTGSKVNPWAILHMTEMKGGWGRIVWMPSWDSENTSRTARNYEQRVPMLTKYFEKPYVSVARNGELLPEVRQAIEVIATKKTRDSNGDLILATGHNSPDEVVLMIKEAVKAGVKHVIITHPLLDSVGMTLEQITQAVALGPEIYAEFTALFGTQYASPETVKRYVDGIRAAGVDHAFVSTDTGQINSDFQPDALAKAAKVLRANGFTEQELTKLFKINPARILGLTPPPGA
jgi:hypothetical protein